MLIDMHMHERTHSSDSILELSRIVEIAKSLGLDAVCITDHDSMGLKEEAERYSKEIGFPIFVGIEYFSLQGDITAWGIDDYPKERVSAQEFVDYVNERGGFTVACHPFRNNNRGLEENLLTVRGLGGVEVLNGSTDMDANRKALEYCRRIGAQIIGASDAHKEEKIGRYVTYLEKDVRTLEEFIHELKHGKTKVAIRNGDRYDVVETF